MANTYAWLVDSLDCIPSTDGKTNVVSVIHWRVNGTDGTHDASIYGTQALTYTPKTPFTAYSELTLATVIGWLQNAIGEETVTAIESALNAKIDSLANPPVVSPVLPWATIK